jgi:hypothetical protein
MAKRFLSQHSFQGRASPSPVASNSFPQMIRGKRSEMEQRVVDCALIFEYASSRFGNLFGQLEIALTGAAGLRTE